MKIIEFNILKKNIKLNVLTHKIDNPDYIVIHLHGFHSSFQKNIKLPDSFKSRLELLSKNNILSYGLEFSGHGKSEGRKAYINNFDDLLDDVDCLIKYIKLYHDINDRKSKHLPIYLLGESLGGAVAIKYSYLHHNVSGIILLAPLCGFVNKINSCNIILLKYLSYIYPGLDISKLNIKKADSTVNSEYNILSKENKYNFSSKLTLCSIRECYLFIKWIELNRYKFNIPLLVFHSKNDKITDFNLTKKFYDRAISSDKEFVELETLNHSLLIPSSDKDRTPTFILNKINCWIKDINYKIKSNNN